jgi:hypothetical protein
MQIAAIAVLICTCMSSSSLLTPDVRMAPRELSRSCFACQWPGALKGRMAER